MRSFRKVLVSLPLWLVPAAALAQQGAGTFAAAPALPTVPDAVPPALPAVPDANKLTLAQAVEIGNRMNPLMTAARYTVEAAHANLSAQRSPANTTVSYSGLNNTVAPFTPFSALTEPTNYAFYWTIETSGRLFIRTRQARAQYNGARADAATTALTVREAVTAAYVNLQVANRGLVDEQEAYNNALKLRDLTKQKFQAGAGPETDVIRAQVALTQELANMYTATSAVKLARENQNIQLGRDPEAAVDAAEPLVYNPVHPKLEDLQAMAARSRPELVSAAFSHQALWQAVDMARAERYPDVIFGHTAKLDGFQAGVAFPLFDYGSIRGAVRQAKKEVLVQEAQTTQLRQSIQLQVSQAYEGLMVAENTVGAFQTGTLPQSESLLQRVSQGYRLGFGTILDILDAQNNLRAVRIAYYGAIGNYRIALSQLEGAVGEAIPALNSAPLQLAMPRH